MNTMLWFYFFNVGNMVSCGVLERHVGCCNYGATEGVLNAMRNRRNFSGPNQFYFIYLFILSLSFIFILFFST